MRILLIILIFVIGGCSPHWVRHEAQGVALYLKDRDAEAVVFYSSIDGFSPQRAEKVRKGVWRVILPVDRECRYFYRIDGHVVTPSCAQREYDDFGGEICIYSP